eukprot:353813-Chlamydomonas_euryale.AAC.4
MASGGETALPTPPPCPASPSALSPPSCLCASRWRHRWRDGAAPGGGHRRGPAARTGGRPIRVCAQGQRHR